MDKLILKNGTAVNLEAGASLADIRVMSVDKAAMVTIWEALTPDNLSEVQIRTEAGATVGAYAGLLLVSETSTVQTDGSILTAFCLREKSDVEKRLEALEEGQTVQDGAIMDVASAVGTLAEGGQA